MMSTLVDDSFDDDQWLFEIKWDGYRAIGSCKDGKADIRSRNDLSFREKYPPVIDALEEWGRDVIVDGEIVSLNEKGSANFQDLQSWQKTRTGELVYFIFDILWLDGYDLTGLPLEERKKILKEILPDNSRLRYSDHVIGKGKEFFLLAGRQGLEGIMAKKKDSFYETGNRSRNWLKIKTTARQEAVIAGYTSPRSGRSYFGALILGIYENGKLVYAGHTGSGFNLASLKDVWGKLKPLVTEICPFSPKPKTNMPATWVKPKLICEIKFQEWTQGHIMRQPIFMGLRSDKKPIEVKKEKEMATKDIKAKKTAAPKKAAKTAVKKNSLRAVKTNAPQEWLPADKNEVVIKLNGQELKLTNLDKLYWKKDHYAKRDLLEYYHRAVPYILPYLKNRPQSLNRHPNGIDSMNFYQKNVEGKVPAWVKTFPDYSESNKETIQYFVCTDEASLIYLANLGCIEMNPWHSTIAKPGNPDYCLIDLDPHEINFEKVMETALVVKNITDQLKIPAYCKTSGSTGIHICIPLGAKYSYEQSKQLAELIATMVHHEIPAFTSMERSPAKRRRKVYLDYLQNAKSQTVACVYSARPKPGAPVSTPLFWEELKKGLLPTRFTIKNIFQRLETEGDIFKPVYGKGIDLAKTLADLETAME
jgi:bifunctional non-homologous end joining protein LigD